MGGVHLWEVSTYGRCPPMGGVRLWEVSREKKFWMCYKNIIPSNFHHHSFNVIEVTKGRLISQPPESQKNPSTGEIGFRISVT